MSHNPVSIAFLQFSSPPTPPNPENALIFSSPAFSTYISTLQEYLGYCILPKVEKIKDYLSDFLVEFLYD
ncbi:MAG: hypothetical protein IJ831_06900, partial [Spirochaetales bacterium]|nr:hypothetical protein [Spirochaetales bacterium]